MGKGFEDAWVKWAWAQVHAHALNADVAQTAPHTQGQALYSYRTHYDPDDSTLVARIDSVTALPERWNLRLGDIIANFRSCLDYIAWEVVQRGDGCTPEEESGVWFPMTDNDTSFDGEHPNRLPGADSADVEVIRRYQPYPDPTRFPQGHPFRVLNKLARADKHRNIQAVGVVPIDTPCEVSGLSDCKHPAVLGPIGGRVLEVGADLQRVHVVTTGDDPRGYVGVDATCVPGLENGLEIAVWAVGVRDLICELLLELGAAPPIAALSAIGVVLTRDGTDLRVNVKLS
jgi:hypothetical protein